MAICGDRRDPVSENSIGAISFPWQTSVLIRGGREEEYNRVLVMLWFFLALGGAISQAAYAGMVKHLLRKEQISLIAGLSFLAASFILCIASMIRGFPATGPGLFPAVAGTVVINIIATILMYRALTRSDLSLCIPMLAFTPVFLLLTSFLILGEIPTIPGACGMVLVTSGAYLLHLDAGPNQDATLLSPMKRLQSDRGVQSMLLVAFLFSISVNFDKQVVEQSDPFFGSMIVFFLLAAAFLLLSVVNRKKSAASERILQGPPLYAYLALGFILACEIIMINLAYTMSIVSYVISIKRLAIVFSVLFGIALFKESFTWGRILGAAIMVAGAGTIALFG